MTVIQFEHTIRSPTTGRRFTVQTTSRGILVIEAGYPMGVELPLDVISETVKSLRSAERHAHAERAHRMRRDLHRQPDE